MLRQIMLLAGIVSAVAVCGSELRAATRVHPVPMMQEGRSARAVLKPSPSYKLSPRRPETVIVKFSEKCREDERHVLLDGYGCSIDESFEPDRFHRVRVPDGAAPEKIASRLEAEEAIVYAEVNRYMSIYLVPDDPFYFPYQWGLQNDLTGGIGMEAAWDIQTGDPNVIIAVLDTGIAYETHGDYRQAPDLAQTLFVPGYDFVNDDAHPNDDQGHGTHVTGTLAQSTNNERGVAGIAFGCSVMPVKVLDNEGVGEYFDIARGIYFAVENGAGVINMSLGSPERSRTIEQALAFAYNSGVTVVCAAGNAFEEGNLTSYPAGYDDYVIAVGAVRYDDTRAYYSNTGSHLDVVAPGGDLLVDQNHDGYPDGIIQQTFTLDSSDFNYYFFQGTSSAAPHVSGVAALLISHGVTHPDAVRAAIERTARDVGPVGWDPEHGWGVVDAYAALMYQAPGDIDGDGLVTCADLAAFSSLWLVVDDPGLTADFNSDGVVDFADFRILGAHWRR